MPYDIFVSYAQRDNQSAEGKPFVSRLLSFIQSDGAIKYGQDIKIFYDGVLESGTRWQKATYAELDTCRVFLPIISPSWVTSACTGDEWDAVSSRVAKDQEDLGNQTRIIPVAYSLDKGSKASLPERVRSLQINHYFQGLMSDDAFRREVDTLLTEIVDRLKLLDGHQSVGSTNSPASMKIYEGGSPSKATVFLGVAFSEDAKKSRHRLKCELGDRGYGIREVDPDLSWTAQRFISEVKSRVDGCSAAVHFLDQSVGPCFPGDPRPLLRIQCDLAKSWEAERFNLFWTGQVPREKLETYPQFILDLKYNNDPVGSLASSLVAHLETQQHKTVTVPRLEPSGVPIIWVICERGDWEVVPEIVSFFREKGWAAFVPGFNARETPVPRIFEKENYFLFYWGKGERDWCHINYEELVDARRVENGFRPPRAALVYNGEAKNDYKVNFEWLFLKAPQYDRFNPNAEMVQKFVSQIQSTFASQNAAA